MKKGLCWSIGSGENIRIWHDPWLPPYPFQLNINNSPFTGINMLKDLLTENRRWNQDLITELFPSVVRNRILSPSINVDSRDKIQCIRNKRKQYDSASVYLVAYNFFHDPVEQIPAVMRNHVTWKAILGLKIPSKIQMQNGAGINCALFAILWSSKESLELFSYCIGDYPTGSCRFCNLVAHGGEMQPRK
ncbi:hypothetical protein AHAS_Ahas12G0168000 [Arachis hypogaea]